MRVLNIQNNYQHNTSFGYWKRSVYKTDGSILHRNDTCVFRQDLDWDILPEFLSKKFANVEKINTYFYGCSDGSEIYSFLITLLTKLPIETVNNFLPIQATDVDKIAIGKAKEGIISLASWEKDNINFYTNNNFSNYFSHLTETNYLPSQELINNINFSIADIRKNCKRIKKDNCLIAARNFWPYLHPRDRYILANNLHKNMGKNSILLVGSYDEEEYDYDLKKILTDSGFIQTPLDYVYETL